jgi:hypothetical protein
MLKVAGRRRGGNQACVTSPLEFFGKKIKTEKKSAGLSNINTKN